jgi:hypothetical protein
MSHISITWQDGGMRAAPYEEELPSGRLVLMVGLVIVALALAPILLVFLVPPSPGYDRDPGDVAVLVVTLAVSVVLGVGVVRMRQHNRVDDVLEVRVTPFWYRRRIAPERIASATRVQMTALNSGGWGIRLVPGGTAILLDTGPGVQVTVSGARSLRFRSNDPDAVLAALEARGASVG